MVGRPPCAAPVGADTAVRSARLEIDADRIAFSRDSLVDPSAARPADVRSVDWTSVPRFDLSISSPPYMTAHDHPQNPLSGYQTMDGDYRTYLADLTQIYRAVSSRAAGPDTRVVVNVADLNSTRLAWDVGTALAEVLTFEREVIIDREAPEPSFTQDYCLVFRPRLGPDPVQQGAEVRIDHDLILWLTKDLDV